MAEQIRLSRAMRQLRSYLREHGWLFVQDGDVLRGVASSEGFRWTWSAVEQVNGQFLAVTQSCTTDVPAARRLAVADYLTRANYGLCFGAFEMDCATGAVYFRTSVPIDTRAGVAAGAIEHLLCMGHCMMSRYLAGLLAVAIGGADPAAAVAAAEDGGTAAQPADMADDPVADFGLGHRVVSDN